MLLSALFILVVLSSYSIQSGPEKHPHRHDPDATERLNSVYVTHLPAQGEQKKYAGAGQDINPAGCFQYRMDLTLDELT